MSDAHVIDEQAGTITVSAGAIEQIVIRAAEAGEGARVRRPRRGLEVEVTDGRATVELELAVRFGAVLPEVAKDVQERVAEALQGMCGLDVASVDVAIEELEE